MRGAIGMISCVFRLSNVLNVAQAAWSNGVYKKRYIGSSEEKKSRDMGAKDKREIRRPFAIIQAAKFARLMLVF
jgi:hypothetical protein